jgi:hypothetical protein
MTGIDKKDLDRKRGALSLLLLAGGLAGRPAPVGAKGGGSSGGGTSGVGV